jgi:hypothetical protein
VIIKIVASLLYTTSGDDEMLNTGWLSKKQAEGSIEAIRGSFAQIEDCGIICICMQARLRQTAFCCYRAYCTKQSGGTKPWSQAEAELMKAVELVALVQGFDHEAAMEFVDDLSDFLEVARRENLER